MRLSGKTALVTGGGRGIGRAVTRRLAAEGAHVVVHYGSDRDAAQATATEIRAAGGLADVLGAPLGGDDIEREVAALWEGFDAITDRLDVLVNNAGTAEGRGTIDTVGVDDLRRLMAVNAVAPFFVTKLALPRLADGGRVVNVSAHLTRGAAQPDLIGYAMTKGAIDVFTATLGKQLGERAITVNAVAPGVVDTDMNAAWLDHARDMVAGLSPLGRVARPSDIGDVVAFLASDDSRWITGQHIDASGGALL
ncbi:3-oxoacyl-[acyl-carrier protein] reductase [Nocardiopsis sp. Huas11]|uniref:SDR family oxidoreductase n=1 Tax=Nocardiopsis sp. Huas11 TaxID=2183912 RepID=UPI000EACEF38|nr:SDR family oxidoreductase [Nocardiopsis sp. Huas11]RKS04837.1 3-oxoacyl-[acyl-carrier protein] reductase [Nocardiopsis sp. Huas11]